MVSNPDIKTILLYNRKVFAKDRYEPSDIVWWIDTIKITGKVMNVRGYYCHIRDEFNNEYIKPHLELFLDETNIIQSLMNELNLVKKDMHNLKTSIEQLQKELFKNYENTSFTIPQMHSKL